MPTIDHCVCTGQSFASLLAKATQQCIRLSELIEATGSGSRCTRCLPYLRATFLTGQVVFHELLPEEGSGPADDASACPPLPEPYGRIVMAWSGGKDSAMALHRLLGDPRYEVVGLLTTVSRELRRVTHHGVREEMVERQATALGLPLRKIYFPPGDDTPPTIEAFEAHMGEVLADYRSDGVFLVGHGDINLVELRAARLRRLRSVGMDGVFPLWGEPTDALLREFTALGFRARLTSVEPALGAAFAGAELGVESMARFPAGIDPCGENGEYHSFVYDGPIFPAALPFADGETVERDGRYHFDILPVDDRGLRSPASPPTSSPSP